MTYHRKVIFTSLGILLGVALLGFLSELLSAHPEGMIVGLITLGFSLFEGVVLLIIALVVRLGDYGGATEGIQPPADLLDAPDTPPRPLTAADKARAFLAAAGLVFLVGGSICYGSLAFG